ncbi:acyl-CoA dehydrogenase family protein [Nocardia aurantia]|uniref:Caffeyl-CoA reductase-Etf complex subunit CarC n=1 Tax=Nocardia aurantia TaxID=2585199 RepID=A0A7K0E1W0_9NOCA|nr:acyl-CoA dehydrogenase family protein [Nocardia aurantia]MQY31134.1 Caffeyl-CoA reductase-Etf complex subunit CarC [Nocardia aurantia]
MSDDLSEFHDELRTVARELLAAGSGAALDRRQLARTGWLGLEAADEYDGAEATFAEVAVILHEFGRAAAPGPYPTVAALAITTLEQLRPGPDRDRLLRDTVAGAATPVPVFDAELFGAQDIPAEPAPPASGSSAATDSLPIVRSVTPFRLVYEADRVNVSGTADFVLDAPEADRLLLLAADDSGIPVVVPVDPSAPGLTVTTRPVVDLTRSIATVSAEDVAVEQVWRFVDNPYEALRYLRDRAAVAVACDSLGLSEAMLDATVDYARVREQFGRPIGSFQAVKHACADMLVQITIARKLIDAAIRGLTDESADGAAAAMAKSYACTAAVDIVGKAMQLHGGIGYTWESGIHTYLKRALLNRSLYGAPADHRRRLSRRYA